MNGPSAPMRRRRAERLLALEIRPRKFGFVVFAGPTRVLDWGVRCAVKRDAPRQLIAGKAVRSLLDLHEPSAVVVRVTDRTSKREEVAVRAVAKAIRAEARRRSIEWRTIHAREVKRLFAQYGCKNKQQAASLIGEWSEELSWKVPRERKAWQAESYHACIFDAAAAGIAFFHASEPHKTTHQT